ncbi:MAG TPA: hypothetical protein VGO37_20245 [Steroidobacteraceae bacterium]|nr:hypothetical protein [Steroidobacteraceae bacterium]
MSISAGSGVDGARRNPSTLWHIIGAVRVETMTTDEVIEVIQGAHL